MSYVCCFKNYIENCLHENCYIFLIALAIDIKATIIFFLNVNLYILDIFYTPDMK